MDEIRVLEEEHIPDAAALYLRIIRGSASAPTAALLDEFRRTYLLNPWATDDIAPLVYLAGGRVVAFLGVIPRPMLFRDHAIRAATIALWAAEPASGMAGVKLLRHLLRGPQEFTYSDGVGNEASGVFEAMGAKVSHLHSLHWMRVLRPMQQARLLLNRRYHWLVGGTYELLTSPVQVLLDITTRPHRTSYTTRDATPAEFLCMLRQTPQAALRATYSDGTLDWLIRHASQVESRAMFVRTVYTPTGELAGGYVCYVTGEKPAEVLRIEALRPRHFAEVLRALFRHMWDLGVIAVKGQFLPQHAVTLTENHCFFREPHACAIGHSHHPDIMNAFLSGNTSLSRLDAEAWLCFSSQDWRA